MNRALLEPEHGFVALLNYGVLRKVKRFGEAALTGIDDGKVDEA